MNRADGRGHWPRGKRRHALDPARHKRVMQQVRTLLDTRATRGEISRRALAGHLGVSETAIRRWLNEEDLPPPAMLRRLEAWVWRKTMDLPENRQGGA